MKFRYLKDVVTLQLDAAKCTGCGICVQVCPRDVLMFENDKAVITDRDACNECGACSRNCPFEAVFVRAGVGCVYAVLYGKLKGTEPQCGCTEDTCC